MAVELVWAWMPKKRLDKRNGEAVPINGISRNANPAV